MSARINTPVCLASIRQLQATYAKIKRQLSEERAEDEQGQSADQDRLADEHIASDGIGSSGSTMEVAENNIADGYNGAAKKHSQTGSS
jgi:hypothetical protein